MQRRKTPATLLSMAGILIIVGGFLFVRGHRGDRDEIDTPANNTATTTTNYTTPEISVATSTDNNLSKLVVYGQVSIRLKQTLYFADLNIKPVQLVEDSRCPKGVQCIQAGTVRINLQIVGATGTTTKILKVGDTVSVGGESITFVSVQPERIYNQTIQMSDYVFTLNVVKNAAPTVTAGKCFVGGCSGEICSSDQGMVSACIYKAEYACYKSARCERQTNGKCGFTDSSELKSCLANPPTI